jgi:hypothetical protein
MNSRDLASLVFFDVEKSGGSSRNRNGKAPGDGFMVGGVAKEYTITVDFDSMQSREQASYAILAYLAHNEDLLWDRERYIGAWLDDGTLYLDISERYSSEGTAHAVAAERNELAYYDVIAERSVFVRNDHQ